MPYLGRQLEASLCIYPPIVGFKLVQSHLFRVVDIVAKVLQAIMYVRLLRTFRVFIVNKKFVKNFCVDDHEDSYQTVIYRLVLRKSKEVSLNFSNPGFIMPWDGKTETKIFIK
jgi:hypothetical protein